MQLERDQILTGINEGKNPLQREKKGGDAGRQTKGTGFRNITRTTC